MIYGDRDISRNHYSIFRDPFTPDSFSFALRRIVDWLCLVDRPDTVGKLDRGMDTCNNWPDPVLVWPDDCANHVDEECESSDAGEPCNG